MTFARRFSWSRRARFGNVFDDVDDTLSTIASPITDTWDALKDDVPGFQEVSDAVDAVVTGPVRDFARTAIGRTILTAAASSLTGGLAPLLGPQLATVAFAMPGMAAGTDFARAWTLEFASRVQQTASILGTQYAGQIAAEAYAKLKAYSDKFDVAPFAKEIAKYGDFKELARRAGVREDYAALFLAGYVGDMSIYTSRSFDARTGAEITGSGAAAALLAKIKAAQLAEATARQRASSERVARERDLGAFRAMLSPVVAQATAAAAASAAPSPAPTFSTSSPDRAVGEAEAQRPTRLGLIVAGAVGVVGAALLAFRYWSRA